MNEDPPAKSADWPRGAIFTIGHSTMSIDRFVGLLRAFGVERLVDVRSVPRSRHNPQFNADALAGALAASGIDYAAMPSLGGLRHVAIMCAEAVPWRCHRSLVADALMIRGVPAIDILPNADSRPHALTPFAHVEGTRLTYPPEQPSLL